MIEASIVFGIFLSGYEARQAESPGFEVSLAQILQSGL
jgi:hypothetical protein